MTQNQVKIFHVAFSSVFIYPAFNVRVLDLDLPFETVVALQLS